VKFALLSSESLAKSKGFGVQRLITGHFKITVIIGFNLAWEYRLIIINPKISQHLDTININYYAFRSLMINTNIWPAFLVPLFCK
jgi:hypothetical protein